ncbi:hypothetical protein AcV5_007789 [Taiwanofungus camphoratus]|nr:hypothetical protein AcV5_007789 [Antrodia cinnamomea]
MLISRNVPTLLRVACKPVTLKTRFGSSNSSIPQELLRIQSPNLYPQHKHIQGTAASDVIEPNDLSMHQGNITAESENVKEDVFEDFKVENIDFVTSVGNTGQEGSNQGASNITERAPTAKSAMEQLLKTMDHFSSRDVSSAVTEDPSAVPNKQSPLPHREPYASAAVAGVAEEHRAESDHAWSFLTKFRDNSSSLASSTENQESGNHEWHEENDSLRLRTIIPHKVDEAAHPTGDLGSPSKLPFYRRRVEGLLSPTTEASLEDLKLGKKGARIPRLHHGLSQIISHPGVHWTREPRTGIPNFGTQIQKVPDPENFAFDRVSGFVTSSRDEELWSLAKREGCSFAGSTSSLTGMLSQVYFLLSREKWIDVSTLSAAFLKQPRIFTPGQRMPVSVTLQHRDGVYSTDSDISHLGAVNTENILSKLGIMLEKFFTMPPSEFKQRFEKSSVASHDPQRGQPTEAYRYAKYGKFAMRAQLDCRDPRLPGSGVFDIKTRAVAPIRLDVHNYKEYSNYQIHSVHGPWNSFEKEYYDLIRSAFLKYSFQARIGNMDGVMIAYHNTAQIFGFQYVPLEEMDERLYGNKDVGSRVFGKCLGLLNAIFSEIIVYFPGQTVHCTAETKQFGRLMHIWIEPEVWIEEKPVVQLDVKVTSFLGNERVPGWRAIESADLPWTVTYSIAKSPLPQSRIKANRQSAYDRQLRIYETILTANELVDHGDNVDPRLLQRSSAHRPTPSAKPKRRKRKVIHKQGRTVMNINNDAVRKNRRPAANAEGSATSITPNAEPHEPETPKSDLQTKSSIEQCSQSPATSETPLGGNLEDLAPARQPETDLDKA